MTSYLKINANGSTPTEVVDLSDVPKADRMDELRKNLSHSAMGGSDRIFLDSSTYTLWCSDGKRYKVEIVFDDDGNHKGLIPNHRINAMVNLGRFTSKKFNYVGKSRNQDIKDTWGSNYFLGDVFVKITTGRPLPDISIFGSSPILSIVGHDFIPSAKMSATHADAEGMLDPRRARADYGNPNSPKNAGGMLWEFKDYHIIHKECRNVEYITLLKSWGVSVEA